MDAQSNVRGSRGGVRHVRAPMRWAWVVALIIAALAGLAGHRGPDYATPDQGSAAAIDADLPKQGGTDRDPESRAMRS